MTTSAGEPAGLLFAGEAAYVPRMRAKRSIVAGAAAVLILLLILAGGWLWLWPDDDFAALGAIPPGPGRTQDVLVSATHAVEARIAEAPEYAPFFRVMGEHFPADRAQIIDAFTDRALTTAQLDTPDAYMSEAIRALRQTRGIVAARAGLPALARIFETQRNLLRELGAFDPRTCVDFLYGAAQQGYFDFATRNRAMIAEMGMAALAAIIDGEDRNDDLPAVTDADFEELESGLQKAGLSRQEIDALLDGQIPNPPLPDERMCQAGQTYLVVLATLPEPLRQKIYGLAVQLMARS